MLYSRSFHIRTIERGDYDLSKTEKGDVFPSFHGMGKNRECRNESRLQRFLTIIFSMVHLTKRIFFHTRSNRQISYNSLEIVLYFTKLCTKRNRPNVSKRSIFIIVRIFSFFKSSSLLNSLRLFFFSPFLRVEKLVKE